jgi:hypothetical protein
MKKKKKALENGPSKKENQISGKGRTNNPPKEKSKK